MIVCERRTTKLILICRTPSVQGRTQELLAHAPPTLLHFLKPNEIYTAPFARALTMKTRRFNILYLILIKQPVV